jgi:diacylglycerol O-acyltransferase
MDDSKDSLSFGDALFLHLEREGMPLNVASLSVFEGEIPLRACMRYVESRLPLIPRYRQRVVAAPLNLGLPSWRWDPEFDIANHVREVRLTRGTEKELRAVAAQLLSATMDRSRPLWDITLLRGLKGKRTGVLVRVHHCLADGLSGVDMMNALMESAPDSHAMPPESWRSSKPRGGRTEPSLLESLVDSCLSAAQRVLTAESELVSLAEHLMGAPQEHGDVGNGNGNGNGEAAGLHSNGRIPSPEEWNRLLPELLGPAERLPFNVVCRGPQKYECAEIPLADLKAAKHACGVSVNDVVLAVVTSAVRRYLLAHGVKVRGRSLRIVVPVSVRRKGEMHELGNRITFVPVNIPLDRRTVRATVAAAHHKMTAIKDARIAELVGFAGTLLGTVPIPLQAAVGPIASQLPLSVCNLICTNVPGPRNPLYLIGHKMLSCYPYVPIGGEMGMNCAVLSYNGTAFFGFTADVNAVPDAETLPRLLIESFADLCREVGIRVEPKSRERDPKRRLKSTARSARKAEPAAERRVQQAPSAPVLQFDKEVLPERKTTALEELVLRAAG